jgi:glutathione S-transferase
MGFIVKETTMLKLNVFGPFFGLPDGSPFCIKGLMLMKMSGLPFETAKMNFRKAPKGKAPYLQDGDTLIADSHFLMRHLETARGADFSGGYSAAELAKGWAVARMMEEHFYFLSMNVRWMNDENFWKGPYQFFADAPGLIRPLIARIVRKKVRKTHDLQGLGRHTPEERLELAKGDLNAIEAILGRGKYLLGDKVSGADATAAAFVWAGGCKYFDSPIGDYIRTRPILMAYITRIRDTYFPGFDV